MASTRQQRNTRRNRNQDEGVNTRTDERTDEREQSSEDDVTPSASFIETANPARNPQITEKPTDLGWKVYSLKERNMRMKLHVEFLKTCIEEDIIPKGLTIDLRSTTGRQDETFQNKWKEILSNCSRQLAECLVEHYERQLAQNIAVIADTFESLEKIEDWTDRDKQQVEQEIESIIDTKEKQLKEKKEKKLETARKNKQPVQEAEHQPLDRGTETYAEVVKKHIRQKLTPNKSDPTRRKIPPEERGQRRYYERSSRDREWGYRRYQQQSLDYNQHEGGKRQSQRRYFLSGRPPARNRYKD